MMSDRSLDIILIVFFSLCGLVIVSLAWIRPMVLPERLMTSVFGFGGIVFATLRVFRLRSPRAEGQPLSVKVEKD